MTSAMRLNPNRVSVQRMFATYGEMVRSYHKMAEEIRWDMLSASAFINSVATTTGYGDIVPVTLTGKICTILYALYGIPVFIWYIIKLGVLFRVLVMRFNRHINNLIQ